MNQFKIKIYADGADINGMLEEYKKGIVKGFTTNPSLMKKAGVKDYKSFSKEVLKNITDMPISFEVFADDEEKIMQEAREIKKWGENLYIKVPITNTKGVYNSNVIKTLSNEGVKLNVTAIFTIEQVKEVLANIDKNTPAIISIFAGRIADTGVNPVNIMKEAVSLCKNYPNIEILWASCRELYNIFDAQDSGCHIVTVQNDLLKKLNLIGKDLLEYSKETVVDFFKDGKSLGFTIL